MFSSPDDLILGSFGKINEVSRINGNPHHQIRIFLTFSHLDSNIGRRVERDWNALSPSFTES